MDHGRLQTREWLDGRFSLGRILKNTCFFLLAASKSCQDARYTYPRVSIQSLVPGALVDIGLNGEGVGGHGMAWHGMARRLEQQPAERRKLPALPVVPVHPSSL